MLKAKKTIIIVLVLALLIISVGTVLTKPVLSVKGQNSVTDSEFSGWYQFPKSEIEFSYDNSFKLATDKQYSIPLNISKDGNYNVFIKYKPLSDIILKSTLEVNIGDNSCLMQVYSLWQDIDKEFPTDSFGNQLPANQKTLDEFITDVVTDQSSVSKRPFIYKLSRGKNILNLKSNDVDLEIERIVISKELGVKSTDSYKLDISNKKSATKTYIIEAEKTSFKTESSIRAGCVRNSALYPYDYKLKKCNVLDSASFYTVGQKVQYVFKVNESGVYNLGFRYNQNYKEDLPAYENILIDSKPICDAYMSVPFGYTGSDYQNLIVGDNKGAIGVYLKAGEHTVTLEADGTPVAEIINRLSKILSDFSSLGVEIKKVSGGDANQYQTWDIEEYMPGLIKTLEDYRDELKEIYKQLGKLQNENPAAAVNTKLASDNITKLLKNKNKIPGNLQLLNEGSGSATQFLADQIDKLTYQNLSIDRIYIFAPSFKLPKASSSAFTNFACGVKRLVKTVTSKDASKDFGKDEHSLNIWVNRSVQYVDTIKALTDSEFTKKTGIKINFSVMSSEQRIILANAGNSAPDVVMGLASNTPFDLGVRGAVMDLTEFSDFGDYISKEYNIQTLVPYVLGNKIFGVTETQEFYVLMMRTDIMDKLGLKAPKTWKDVSKMMPVLRRNSMNFYLQLSGYSGTKPLYSTIPFILQSGGNIYSSNGLSTAIQSNEAFEGFKTLTDLYRLYSVQKIVSSFYNSFRYGQIPIGIASFSDYVKIKNAAPEITGLWKIALSPGFEDKNGNVHYGTTGASTAAAIMSSCKNKKDAWEFLKWWLSSDVQIKYGNTMQMTYGTDYLWNTANVKAFKNLAFPKDDKDVILKQWEQMTEVYRHPALYAVERELSNAWNNVVIDGKPARIALDDASTEINHEFNRKLYEFGFIDENGNTLKEFNYIDINELLKKGANK